MSNYSQNSNNYFENLIGELTNLKKENITQWFIVITFDNIPYYDKNGNIIKYEKFNKTGLYEKLKIEGLLDNLSIIKLSNGINLKNPNNIKIEDIKGIDKEAEQFKIIYSNFDFELKNFCYKINTKK